VITNIHCESKKNKTPVTEDHPIRFSALISADTVFFKRTRRKGDVLRLRLNYSSLDQKLLILGQI